LINHTPSLCPKQTHLIPNLSLVESITVKLLQGFFLNSYLLVFFIGYVGVYDFSDNSMNSKSLSGSP